MNRRLAILALTLPLALCANTGDSSALGLGIYGGSLFGTADWKTDTFGIVDPNGTSTFDIDADGDLDGFRAGIVLDTAPKQHKIFNYRLNLGASKFDADWENIELDGTSTNLTATAEMTGGSMDHTFGFGVVRTDMVRLWLGPSIRLGYYTGELEDELDIKMLEFGVAPVVGLNLNFGSLVTIGGTVGYLFSGFAGIIDDQTGDDVDLTGTASTAFVNGVLMFRMGADSR